MHTNQKEVMSEIIKLPTTARMFSKMLPVAAKREKKNPEITSQKDVNGFI